MTYTEKQQKLAEQKLVAYLKPSKKIKRLINAANADLYFGPKQISKDYPGFVASIKLIRAWWESQPNTLYWNGDLECWQKRLSKSQEIDSYEIYEYDYKELKKLFFGDELASYI